MSDNTQFPPDINPIEADPKRTPIQLVDRFGGLLVLELTHRDGRPTCRCRCDCGAPRRACPNMRVAATSCRV